MNFALLMLRDRLREIERGVRCLFQMNGNDDAPHAFAFARAVANRQNRRGRVIDDRHRRRTDQ